MTNTSTASDPEQIIDYLLSKLDLAEKISLLSGQDNWRTAAVERLGISSLVMTDGPHGVRADKPDGDRPVGKTTCFPTGVALAATWNPELIAQVGAALGEETRAMECDILLGPCVNIIRHPLWGRNFETYAEDPYLAGRIGAAYVRGVQSRGVGTSPKHYACNNQETERFRASSEVDERTLREIYLPAFETIVKEARPWTVMCAYNRINGVYASQHDYLLNKILKEEWGFAGAVVSDWGANHTTVESLVGGLDLEMPGPPKYYGHLLGEAVRHWQIDPAVIDRSVRRLLRVLFWAGKLPNSPQPLAGSVNTPEHQALARRAAEEAITLLKNDGNLLPLDKSRLASIAVIGPNAARLVTGGGGSSYVEPPYRISLLEGLRAALGDTVRLEYAEGADNFNEPPVIHCEYLSVPETGERGMRAEYFANIELAGPPATVRIDPRPDFWWWGSDPAPNVSVRAFSARWSAILTVPASCAYLFRIGNSCHCRVFLDDELLLDNRAPDATSLDARSRASATRELTAGQPYALRVEFIKTNPRAFAHVRLELAAVYPPEANPRPAQAAAVARQAEVAIVCVGMIEGYESEGYDRPDMDLPARQNELIRAVARANPRTIVILNAGVPVSMPWLDEVAAVALAYYPGQEGGHALARVLLGEINPSGRLPVTFPKHLRDSPAWLNSARPEARQVIYGEGVFVGYRYYDYKEIEPLFPFGHGLTYTTFEYSRLQTPAVARRGQPIRLTLTVKNIGQRAGQEVVQLYVHDRHASVARPPKELKGFVKIKLEPGENRTVEFELDERALAFYDPARHQWVAEPGEFEVLVGSSSRDIRARTEFVLE